MNYLVDSNESSFSLTRRFSGVWCDGGGLEPFQRFGEAGKPLKRLESSLFGPDTPLKRGVNERVVKGPISPLGWRRGPGRGGPSCSRWWLAFCLLSSGLPTHAQEKITFQDHVLPLVENNCGKCHNPDKKKADLDLTTYAGVMKGSGSGQVVVSGNPDGSKLWRAITQVEEPTMPPNKPKLPDKELDVFRTWIMGGLLETSGSKALAASKPAVDFTLKAGSVGKPDGPPPMPVDLSLEPVIHTAHSSALTGLATSPWAPLIALAGQKQVLLYNSDSLDLLGVLPFTEGQPADVTFSRSGALLLAGGGRGGKSGRVLVWNIVTGERLMTIGDEYDTVLAADIRPDQTQIALGGPGRLVKIYSSKTGELQHKKKKHTDWVTAIAFSPNGAYLASGDRNGGISIWDPDNGQELFTLAGHKAGVTALSWRGDSKLLASCSEDGSIKWWEMQDGKQAKTWEAHKGGALSVSYTHDGRMVSCGRDHQIVVWNADGTKARAMQFTGEIPLRATFNHDGSRVFATDFSGHFYVWKAADGKQIGELEPNPLPLADQLAAAEKRIADLQKNANKPSANLQAAEGEAVKANTELDQATKALEQAKAEQTTRENEVVRLKAEAAKTPPPADIAEKLENARAVRFKARQSATNALETLQAKTKAASAAKEKLAQIQAENPADALASLKASAARIKAAQASATVFRARESLAAKKREQEKLAALAAEKQDALKQATQDLSGATDSAAKSKLKAALKTATAEAKSAEAALRKCASELAGEQARLEKLTAEYQRVKTASNSSVQESKL